MSTPCSPSSFRLPKPLATSFLSLRKGLKESGFKNVNGIPSKIHVAQWGTPLKDAKHVVFFFGGMPASALEPALHSVGAAAAAQQRQQEQQQVVDIYAQRKIHLICIDKVGMGGTSFAYRFSLNRDWPRIVNAVANHFHISQYGVMGMSNGGPYTMACLAADAVSSSRANENRILAGAMIVGVSDVNASGYFSWKHPSGLLEGIFGSLPLVLTGPINFAIMGLTRSYMFGRLTKGYESSIESLVRIPAMANNADAKSSFARLLKDSSANFGLGIALDCQQGLSPIYNTRYQHNKDNNNSDNNKIMSDNNEDKSDNNNDDNNKNISIRDIYRQISVPVSLWYGKKDASVPMSSAEWLDRQLVQSKLHKVDDAGHELFFPHAETILDELIENMTASAVASQDNENKNS